MMPELCASILKDAPESIRGLRPDVPPQLDAAILRCLEKNPAARFANVAELTNALVDHAPKRSRLSAERSNRIPAARASSPRRCRRCFRTRRSQAAPVAVATATARSVESRRVQSRTPRSPRVGNARWAVAGPSLPPASRFPRLARARETPVVSSRAREPFAGDEPLALHAGPGGPNGTRRQNGTRRIRAGGSRRAPGARGTDAYRRDGPRQVPKPKRRCGWWQTGTKTAYPLSQAPNAPGSTASSHAKEPT